MITLKEYELPVSGHIVVFSEARDFAQPSASEQLLVNMISTLCNQLRETLTQTPKPSRQNYWLLVASRFTWKHLQSKREWAFAERLANLAGSITDEDSGVVYLRSDSDGLSALGGLVSFTSTTFRTSGSSLFDQAFPIRLGIRLRQVLDPPIPFKPLVRQIGFIKTKSNWGCCLQGKAALRLNEDDYNVLTGAFPRNP